ncbi:MAG: molybdopterin-dependent oxidoreductase [Pseudomonadales bacterium]|nr:molybdopterin-dependent oxidoreductase [Pseudomonadales bacterium]
MNQLLTSIQQILRQNSQGQAIDRRQFLKLAGVAGTSLLLIAPSSDNQAANINADNASTVGAVELNAFVSIASDGKITIYSSNPEMGQGIKTALPMIIAEELGADWTDVEVLQSPVDSARFGRHGAGGSTTIPRTFDQMRQLGASAREMLLIAGAISMELPKNELVTRLSQVVHPPTGNFMRFGQLAALAAKQPLPNAKTLAYKKAEDYTLIGTSVTGVDNLEITTGAALFGIDTQIPDMLYAIYHKCPAIGGKVINANIDQIKKLPGIKDAFILKGNDNVRELLDGVAIVGSNTWAVFKAQQQLVVEWDEADASKDNWPAMVKQAEALAKTTGATTVLDKGKPEKQFTDPENTTLEAFYEYPFVAHLCLEPMNCTASYQTGTAGGKDTLELWIPTQAPERAYQVTQGLFDLDNDQVLIHQMRLGGSFGRRIYNEYVCEATAISKRMNAPVKLTWRREDDIQHDFYRVGGFQAVKGAINSNGQLVAFKDHFIGMLNNGKAVSGSRIHATEFPAQNIRHAHISKTMLEIGTPCGPWRAPGSNTSAFVIQSFLHELALAGKRDHLDFLLELMGEPRWFESGNIRSLNTGRASAVIRLAAEKAGWGGKLAAGHGLGLAFYFSHAAHVAEVAEVSVDSAKKLTVHKVTVAVDVGPIINMSGALSQVSGAVIDGLSTMMGQKITMQQGRIEQSNLHDYKVLRMPSVPIINTHFIQSKYPPTGLGEPALPPLAPAIGNAIFAATGERVRKMPLAELGYTI